MRPFKTCFSFASLALVAAALTACGGGGGGGSTPPVTPPVTPPADVVSPAGTLQTTAPAPSYAASSVQLGMFQTLNDLRIKAGAGALLQSPTIDVASQAHADYLHFNPADGHVEIPGKTGFYAPNHGDRLTKAGFSYAAATESIGGTGASRQGSDCSLGLLNTVYHAQAMLSQFTHVGNGTALDGLGVPICVYNLATASGNTYGQVPASGKIIKYPYSGQTGVFDTFHVGYETPRPPVALFPNLTAGHPVLVSVRNADFLNFTAAGTINATIDKFELRDASGNLVPGHILAHSGLKAASGVSLNADTVLSEGWAVFVPSSPLTKNATYSVTFNATLKAGTVITDTWSFKTN